MWGCREVAFSRLFAPLLPLPSVEAQAGEAGKQHPRRRIAVLMAAVCGARSLATGSSPLKGDLRGRLRRLRLWRWTGQYADTIG